MTTHSRREILKVGTSLALVTCTTELLNPKCQAADPYDDAVLVDGEPEPVGIGGFTIAVLPDTQHYSEQYPETYSAQTKWIVENQQARNIACVLHLGDITNHSQPTEWENAVQAMRQMDGKVPYFMVPGNHDYGTRGHCGDRSTMLNEYFPVKHFSSLPTFGGNYDREPDRMENSYHLFSAGKRRFVVLALEFGPRQDVVRWANEVIGKNSDREAILITHAYMYFDDTRYDWKTSGPTQSWNPHSYAFARKDDDVLDGTELWEQLISKHENFILTLNGHVLGDGLGRMTSATPAKRNVHQMLVNFQMRPNGGDGWLRLLQFQPDSNLVHVVDYSPTRRQQNHSLQNRFTLELSGLV